MRNSATALERLAVVLLAGAMLLAQTAVAQQSAPSSPATAPSAVPKAETSTTIEATPPSVPGAASATTPKATQPPASAATTPGKKTPSAKPVKKVDLNNATLEQLKTLPTVGDAEAKKIIAHRPYKSKGELVTKAGLPEGVYHAVKHKVELQTPRKPAPQK